MPLCTGSCNIYYFTAPYIIESIEFSSKHYIGYSSDLRQRLLDHNAGKCSSTAKYRPWKLIQYTAFESVDRALAFEKYLKSGSGHAFAKRHFFDKK